MKKAEIPADRSIDLLNITMIDALERAAQDSPDAPFLVQPAYHGAAERIWTYQQLLTDARRIAAFLARNFSRGDRLATVAPTSASWFLYQFAASHLGLVLVSINPAMTEHEIEYMLATSGARGLLIVNEFHGRDFDAMVARLRPRLPALEIVMSIADWADHVAQGSDLLPPSPTEPDDPALIIFTSGTTGRPKGAVLTQAACVDAGKASADRGGLPAGSTWLATLPVFHCGGPITLCLAALSKRNKLIVMPPFEPGMVLELIETQKINWAPLVPAMLIPMMEHPRFAETDLSSLRALLFGGTTLAPAFLQRARELTGAEVQTVFGMTEGAGSIFMSTKGDPIEVVSETVGTPLPHVAVRVVDPTTETIVDTGVVGELRYRSPYMTIGYFGDAEATAKLFDADGFLRTGDLGLVDDNGRIHISGRLKEMIIRKGENIYPAELEQILTQHPDVAEAAVIGIPHPTFGEEAAAVIRPAAGRSADTEELRTYLLERVARFKVPKIWRVVENFPRSAIGKIQKFELQKTLEAEIVDG